MSHNHCYVNKRAVYLYFTASQKHEQYKPQPNCLHLLLFNKHSAYVWRVRIRKEKSITHFDIERCLGCISFCSLLKRTQMKKNDYISHNFQRKMITFTHVLNENMVQVVWWKWSDEYNGKTIVFIKLFGNY